MHRRRMAPMDHALASGSSGLGGSGGLAGSGGLGGSDGLGGSGGLGTRGGGGRGGEFVGRTWMIELDLASVESLELA